MAGFARLLLCFLLLSATAAAPVRAAGATLVIVEPDAEIVGHDGDPVLPSAADSEALVRRWPAAAAQVLRVAGGGGAWRPPDDLRHDDAVAQALGLQDAVARALLERDVRPRPLSLGDASGQIAAVTGATHALFARIRAQPRRGTAVAMLVDLRTGEILRHRAVHGVEADPAPEALASRLARELLAGWRGLPAFSAADAGVAATATEPGDIARAAARLEVRLRRHPYRLDDPELEQALRDVGCRVDAETCASLRPIVLRDPVPYAAVLPGGALVIHTGLLRRLGDEAELAFLLAHELAHERRGDTRARRDAAPGPVRGDAARAREAAADRDAIARLVAAGYDPAAVVALWERLSADAGPAGTLGSHPPTADRLAAARVAARPARGGERGAERWEALVAPRRARWEADVVRPAHGAAESTVASPEPVTAGGSRVRTLRVLGLRLPTALPWRQRPGIGAVEWTVDGTPLNRLVIVSGVDRGEPMLPGAGPDASHWDGSAPGSSTTAAIAAALRAAGWFGVQAGSPRRHDFGGVPGVRAELSLADEVGLRYRGTLALGVRGGKLTWVAWVAPAAVYHPRDAADVAGMLDGMRFAR